MFAVSEEMIEATSRMEESSQVFFIFILLNSKKCKNPLGLLAVKVKKGRYLIFSLHCNPGN
jgi:hypothetical protein